MEIQRWSLERQTSYVREQRPRVPWGAAAPVIENDQGNRPTVTSGGVGGSDSQSDGEFGLHGTLSPRTAWLGLSAIDGMKMHASASQHSNRDYRRIVEEILQEANPEATIAQACLLSRAEAVA